MADNDVRIKLSLDGSDQVEQGLAGVGDGASQTDSKVEKLGKGLAGAGKVLVGFAAAGVAAGSALSVAVIKSYADYEQNLGGIETMFGATSDKLVQYADQAFMTAGLSANDYMSQVTSFSASLLQGLGGDTEAAAVLANTAMVDMSDNANKFGSNIADVQNAYQGFAKQNFTMLDNLKLGYGGTADEMARLINDSGVMGDTFVATAANMDEVSFDKIIEGINAIQTDMGIAGTTAKEASETITGSIGMLQGSFANLLTGLGSADADVATLASNVIMSLETVVTNVAPIIENIGTGLSTLGPQLGGMMTSLVGSISAVIPDIINAGIGMVEGLIAGIGSSLPGLITALVPALVGMAEMLASQLPLLVDAGMKAVIALGEGLVSALPGLMPMAVDMLLGIADSIIENLPMLLDVALQMIMALATGLIEAIPMLVEALPGLIQSLIDFIIESIPAIIQAGMDLLMGIIGALPEIIVGIVEALPQIITSIIEALIAALPLLIQGGMDLLMGLIGALPEIIVGIVGAIPQIIEGITGAVIGAIPQLIEAGVNLLISLVKNIGPIVTEIVKAIPQIIDGIIGAVNKGTAGMISAGGDLVRGIWEGISGAAGWLFEQIGGFVGDVMDNVAGFFGIKSPSTRMRDEIGQFLPSGIGVGVEKNEDAALDPIYDLNKKMMDAAKLPKLGFSQDFSQSLTSTAVQTLIPISTAATPTMLTPQTVRLDATEFRTVMSEFFGEDQLAREVNINNDIKMYDRDPRIVGKQLGRSAKGVLVG